MLPESRLRIFVHLNYGEDVRDWSRRLRQGLVRDPSPYGFAYVAGEVDLSFSRDRSESSPVKLIRSGLKYLIGFDVIHALNNASRMRGVDAIWTHTEKEHLAVALLKLLRIIELDTPVVANSIWVWGWYDSAIAVRRWFTRMLLRTHAINCVGAVNGAVTGSRALETEVILFPFGTEPFRPLARKVASSRPRIVAPGNDKDRDWDLLGDVARRRPDLDFVVLSRRRRARRLASLSNVEVRAVTGISAMEEELAQSDVLVIPCKENPHASGATTVVQALTAQRPVVVTDVGGIDLYGGTDAIYADLGDVEDFIRAIDVALERSFDAPRLAEARQRVYDRGLDEQTYARRHLLATRDVIAGRPVRASVSEARRLDGEM